MWVYVCVYINDIKAYVSGTYAKQQDQFLSGAYEHLSWFTVTEQAFYLGQNKTRTSQIYPGAQPWHLTHHTTGPGLNYFCRPFQMQSPKFFKVKVWRV